MNSKKNKKILVVRFKQIGDSILASPICTSLKETFPDSQIDYVIYEHISSLFQNHKGIDNVISITKEEQKNPIKYFKKVWKITRNKYDIVIDIMSTPKSELFTLLSPRSTYRIGRYKKRRGYTYTHKLKEDKNSIDKVDKFLKMLKPLEDDGTNVKYNSSYSINILDSEIEEMKSQMIQSGININKNKIIFAINSRRPGKVWDINKMKVLVEKILSETNSQGILYYSPDEKEFALNFHQNFLNNRSDVFSNISTKSIRDLAALMKNCEMFVGNEGGGRHIAQSVDTPSIAIFSPGAEKKEWLANKNKLHQGIEYKDVLNKEQMENIKIKSQENNLDYKKELYNSITVEDVYNLFNQVWNINPKKIK